MASHAGQKIHSMRCNGSSPFAATLGALVFASVAGLASGGETGDDSVRCVESEKLIQVPLRWCALEGSKAVTGPFTARAPDTDTVLWYRHERASDNYWIPAANITFRSAMTRDVRERSNFPVINDPYPPGAGGPGRLGDILDPRELDPRGPPDAGDPDRRSRGRELREALAQCDAAWNRLEDEFDTNLEGPIALNLRDFVYADGTFERPRPGGGTEFPVAGTASFFVSSGTGGDVCDNIAGGVKPPAISNGGDGYSAYVAVGDEVSQDDSGALLAHELGHVLFLQHGNGIDDDGNGSFDGCDFGEDLEATPATIMSPAIGLDPPFLTNAQVEVARDIACVTAGAALDPPALLVPGELRSDHRSDPAHDVDEDAVDIVSVAVSINDEAEVTSFSHAMFGDVTPDGDARTQYLMFADLDDDSTTGGAPATLGFSTDFQGAELVTRVIVSFGNEFRRSPAPQVWRFRDDHFDELTPDAQVSADIRDVGDVESRVSFSEIVSIDVANGLRGSIGSRVRVEAIAGVLEDIAGLSAAFESTEQDRVPDDLPMGAESLTFVLTPPEYSVCGVAPEVAQPGQQVELETAGLGSRQEVKVIFGEEPIALGVTDGDGNARMRVMVPTDATPGPHLVTVGIMGTAVTADCSITVAGSPAPPPICDVNVDGVVDVADIRGIFGRRNLEAGAGDADGDGRITVLDARMCVLACTNLGCRSAAPPS